MDFSARNILLLSVCGSSTGPVPSASELQCYVTMASENTAARGHEGIKKTDGKIGMNPVPDC